MNGTGRREHSPTFLDEETESQSTAEWQNLPVASADLSLRLVTQGSPADLPAPVGTHVSRQLPCSWRCVRVVRGVPFLTTELCGGPGARGCCGTRLVPPPPPASATQPSSAFAAAGRRAGGESGIDGDGRCSPARRWLAGAWLAGSLALGQPRLTKAGPACRTMTLSGDTPQGSPATRRRPPPLGSGPEASP